MGIRNLGIRGRAALLVCIAALPLLVLAVLQARRDRDAAIESASQQAMLMARAQAALQATAIDRTRYVLAGFASGASPSALSVDCSSALQRVVAANRLHVNALLVHTGGRVLCSAHRLSGPLDLGQHEYFRRALAAREFTVSDLFVGSLNGQQRVSAAQPIVDRRGRVVRMLAVSFNLAHMSDVLGAAPRRDAVFVLVDRGGRVVARYPERTEFHGRTLVAFDGASDEGFLQYVGLAGVERIGAYARVAGSPFFVVAGIPRAEVERAPRAKFQLDLAMLALVLAAALGISLFGAQRLIVVPLRRLTLAAGRYARGDLQARSGLARESGEIGSLARNFDELAEQVQRTTRALKALSAGNRTLLREKDEAALMQAMCRVAVDQGGYRLALVNRAQHDAQRSVLTVARAGHDEGFVDRLELTWADTERGRGSVGSAIRSGTTCVVRSMASDPRFAPWREAALERGYGSIASFPLRVESEVIGTFSIVAAEEDAFDGPELELLDEMAADLSFGVETLRSNAKRAAAEEALRHATTHDRFTGLPGRIPFLRALDQALQRAAQGGGTLAVIAVNLTNLQDLHDSLGYDPANAAVLESAARLKSAMSPATELARYGADDFVMLMQQPETATVAALAQRLQALFAQPIDVSSAQVDLRVGIGVALFPEHGADGDVLTRRAGLAAREAGRRDAPWLLYKGSTQRENPERLELAAELRRAVSERRLEIHLQPKVELAWGGVRGFEALVRWRHPEKGMVPPLQFVPVAEQTGLIRPMTHLVIELAVRQLRSWRERPRQIPIAVNLSPRNLHEAELVQGVQRLLDEHGVPAGLLEFEITESALAEDPDKAREVLGRLRALGCKLYVDDFGTGYSSLSHLVSLPVHALKIDRSFVRQMTKTREAHAVVASILSMARAIGLGSVAEGVETREEAERLLALGCDEGQGYYYAKPAPPEELSPVS